MAEITVSGYPTIKPTELVSPTPKVGPRRQSSDFIVKPGKDQVIGKREKKQSGKDYTKTRGLQRYEGETAFENGILVKEADENKYGQRDIREGLAEYDQAQEVIEREEIEMFSDELATFATSDIYFDDYPTRPNPSYKPEIQRSPAQIAAHEAQKTRAQRLKDSPAFQVMFSMLRRSPQWQRDVLPVLARKEAFKTNVATSVEGHRNFTALFTALALSDKTRDILNHAIDMTIADESTWLKEQLRSGNTYTPELGIGTDGVHGSIYYAERIALNPNNIGIAVTRNEKIGGQFAQPDDAVFDANSRNRDENTDFANLPGTPGSLNTLGKGVMQPSDLSPLSYQTQDTIALAVRINALLSLNRKTMTNMNVLRMRQNRDTTQRGSMVAEMEDTKTGEKYEVFTDRVIYAGSVGKEKYGLDEDDPQTKRILKEEQEKYDRGEIPGVMTGQQFAQLQGDKTNPFPLQGFETVIVIASGDSGKATVKRLLGYGPAARKSVMQLDRVRKVIWVGQPSLTKEAFEQRERPKYRDLGLEFPREDDSTTNYRIEPIPAKGTRIRKLDSKYSMQLGDDPETGRPAGVTDFADHIVLTTGFEDESTQLFSPLTSEIYTDAEQIRFAAETVLQNPGSVIYKPYPTVEKDEIIAYDPTTRTSTIRTTFTDDVVSEERITPNTIGVQLLIEEYKKAKAIELTIPDTLASEEVFDFGDDDSPIATRYYNRDTNNDLEVYRIGPAAGLIPTAREKAQSPALAKIPENSASIFLTAGKTRRLAEYLDDRERATDTNFAETTGLHSAERLEEIVRFETVDPEKPSVSTTLFVDQAQVKRGYTSPYVTPEFLQLVVGTKMHNYSFPDGVTELVLTVAKDTKGEPLLGNQKHTITMSPAFSDEGQTTGFIQNLFSDPIMQQTAVQLSHRPISPTETFTIHIPLSEKKPDIMGIHWKIPPRQTTPVKKQ